MNDADNKTAKCQSATHDEHLCSLQYAGWHYGHKAEYKALVQDAAFLCENCGRTAKSAGNLCKPLEL